MTLVAEKRGAALLKKELDSERNGKEAEFQNLIRELEEFRVRETTYQKALELERERADSQEKTFDLRLLDARKMLDREIRDLMDKLRVEENRRRKLFEQVQMLRGTIRVICRIRPDASDQPLDYETEIGEYHDHPVTFRVREEVKKVWGEKRIELSDPYEFERIFLPSETNSDVFSEISDFVQSVVDGKKACIFCYGQSGTGKTYTMSNLDKIETRQEGTHYKNDGIIPRVKTMIFSEKRRLHEIGMEMSARGCCYEIYDNKLWLLKEGKGKDGPIPKTEDSHFRDLNSPEDFDALVEGGMKKRHFGATEINRHSSRSHFIISLETAVKLNDTAEIVREGLLNLVDLAGAESTNLAGTSGASFDEGRNINSSLTQLGTVFVQLANGDIPTFRGNILTEFLERSLSGRDCMTLMFVMISPLRKYWTATKHTLAIYRIGSRGRPRGTSQRLGVKK
ncbi:P-loop containing nucleoside triphosphate hydrolase protein [Hypomontagnella monticulosa]|nr:P-loop containing nucleoside triphosphate hydrolase protein [Hypomontagnella monticulosa]